MAKILGIDYGDQRIGVAVSDVNASLASRFLTIQNDSLKESIQKIKEIIAEEFIQKIVIGVPFGLKTISEQTEKTNHFISYLIKGIDIPVIKISEIFTTKMAKENLLNAGIRKKELKELIDQEAAKIILQDYLDNINK